MRQPGKGHGALLLFFEVLKLFFKDCTLRAKENGFSIFKSCSRGIVPSLPSFFTAPFGKKISNVAEYLKYITLLMIFAVYCNDMTV